MRYHKIAEQPKINHDLPEPERHRYSELEVVDHALRGLLSELYADQNGPLRRDMAHVAFKILYRIEEHHKMARNGRPDYPPFSWEMVRHFAGTAPFTDQEYSTPIVAQRDGHRGGPGRQTSNSDATPAPATPTQETET